MHQSLIGASLILEKSLFTNIQHACLQDSLTAEDFAYSEGLPGNKNNYTLTYRWGQKILSSCAQSLYCYCGILCTKNKSVSWQRYCLQWCWNKHHNREDRIRTNSCRLSSKQWVFRISLFFLFSSLAESLKIPFLLSILFDFFATLSLRYSSMSLKLNTEGITFMSCQQRQFVAVQKGLEISAKWISHLSPAHLQQVMKTLQR